MTAMDITIDAAFERLRLVRRKAVLPDG